MWVGSKPTEGLNSFGMSLYLIDKNPGTAIIPLPIVPQPPRDVTLDVISLIEKLKTGHLNDPKFVANIVNKTLHQKLHVTPEEFGNRIYGYLGESGGSYSLDYETYSKNDLDHGHSGNLAHLGIAPSNGNGTTPEILEDKLYDYLNKNYRRTTYPQYCHSSICYEISNYKSDLLTVKFQTFLGFYPHEPTIPRLVISIDFDLNSNDDVSRGDK